MNDRHDPNRCEWFRRLLSEEMDGRLEPDTIEELGKHLDGCKPCELARADLLLLREDLQGLPVVPFPEDALAEVWAQIVDAPVTLPNRMQDWGLGAAAAAVLALALLATLLLPAREVQPSQEEIARATAETLYVLGVTHRAIEKSEDVALNDVLGRTVSPVLAQIPIRWPATDADSQRNQDQ